MSRGYSFGTWQQFTWASALTVFSYAGVFVASSSSMAGFLTPFAVFVFVIVPSIYLARRNFPGFLAVLMGMVLLQNVITGVVGNLIDAYPSFLVTELKSVFILCGLVSNVDVLVLRKMRGKTLAIVFTLLTLVGVDSFSEPSLAYLRNFLIPVWFLLLCISKLSEVTRDNRLSLLSACVRYATTLMVVGTGVELILGTDTFRNLVGAYRSNTLDSLSTETTFLGMYVRRIGGLLVEPVTTGYISVACLLLVILLRLSKWMSVSKTMWFGGLLVLVTVFCGTKNSLMVVALALVGIAAGRLWPKLGNAALQVLVIVASFVALFGYLILEHGWATVVAAWWSPISLAGSDDSVGIHVAGLLYGIRGALGAPFGNGVGSGGNFARTFAEGTTVSEWLYTGAESGIGALAYQLGFVGLAVFVVLLIRVAANLGRDSSIVMSIWIASACSAESMFGPLVAVFFLLGVSALGRYPGAESESEVGLRSSSDSEELADAGIELSGRSR